MSAWLNLLAAAALAVVPKAPPRTAASPAAKPSSAAVRAAPPASAAAVEPPAAAKGGDVTAAFLEMHALVRGGLAGPLPVEGRAPRYLLVGGFLSDKTPDALQGNLRRHRALGLDSRLVPIDPQGRGRAARAEIGRAVAEAPGQVVLEGHSRGGVLVHDWYRTAPPELKAKVAKVLLLQAPLRGTPYADWYLQSAWRRFKLGWLARLAYGADLRRGVVELGTRFRRRVMGRLPPLSPDDLAKFLIVRTVVTPGSDAYHEDRNRLVTGRSGPGDGTVPLDSAELPGALTVTLDGVNHQHLVLERPGRRKRSEGYRPHPVFGVGDAAEALIRLLFSGRN